MVAYLLLLRFDGSSASDMKFQLAYEIRAQLICETIMYQI